MSSLVAQQIKDLPCHCCGSGYSDSILGPETSVCHGHGQKKKKKEEEEEINKESQMEKWK